MGPKVLDGARSSRELARARALRPFYDATRLPARPAFDDRPVPAAGARRPPARKGSSSRARSACRSTSSSTPATRAGTRLRDYAFFDDPADPRAARCWSNAASTGKRPRRVVALQATLRFLRHFGMARRGRLSTRISIRAELPPQRTIEVTDVVTIDSDDFAFAMPVQGMMVVARARDAARARRRQRRCARPTTTAC